MFCNLLVPKSYGALEAQLGLCITRPSARYEGSYFPPSLPMTHHNQPKSNRVFVPLQTLLKLWAQGKTGVEAFTQGSNQPHQLPQPGVVASSQPNQNILQNLYSQIQVLFLC